MTGKANKLVALAAPLAAVAAVAALACQLAAMRYHGQLLVATGNDRETLAAQTDWHGNLGLALALAALGSAYAGLPGRLRFYSVALGLVAVALYFVR